MPDRPILLIQCPSCLHTNTPGEHFCAACGVPLHLKPCPSCGKVDDAAARTCSTCGAAFPMLAQDQYVLSDVARDSLPAVTARDTDVPAAPVAPPQANRAWPLVIVALVAGGIPFLWMYRANMPLPKAWQVPGPNAAGSAAAPTSVPVATPPAASVAGIASAPAEAGPASKDVPPAGGGGSAAAGDATTQAVEKAAPADQAKTTQAGRLLAASPKPVAKPSAKPVIRPVMTGRPVPPGPCTEGLAALDLCKQDQDSARK